MLELIGVDDLSGSCWRAQEETDGALTTAINNISRLEPNTRLKSKFEMQNCIAQRNGANISHSELSFSFSQFSILFCLQQSLSVNYD